MFDYLRTAATVPTVKPGDTIFNTDEIIKKMRLLQSEKVDITVFPELCISGYTCADLFYQKALTDGVKTALQRIASESTASENVFLLGAPLIINGQLYNCAVVLCAGRIYGIVPKTFIPVYNEYYEKRWFSSSQDLNVDVLSSACLGFSEDYDIPVGRDLLFNFENQVTFGIEICEDLWAPIPPSGFLALNGAEVIFNLSASNETIAKHNYRRDLVKQQSASCICGYVYTSAGKGESTTDLVFSGHSILAENGTIAAENTKSIDTDYIVSYDIDLGKLRTDRMKQKTFKDNASYFASAQPCRIVPIENGYTLCGNAVKNNISKYPFVPANVTDRKSRCMDIFELQVAGLQKRLEHTGAKPIVGVSGGLDSTLALLVATEAIHRLQRPSSDVIGITMPCYGTTDRTHSNSVKLMEKLSVTALEIPIGNAVAQHFSDIGQDPNSHDLTYENAQARERTQVLMDYAGRVGGLVVGTGDLSELALGWCTYNADHMSMYGVNVSIPKTLVKWMIVSLAQYDVFSGCSAVLTDIADTPISPELLPPDKSGKIAQKTEELVGPYTLHDFFLYYVLRYGFAPEKIYYLAKLSFQGEYDNATILKWLQSFYKRFFSQQFKRSCLPDGVKVGSICLSPRGDWRMPSDASVALWLEQVQKLVP